MKCGDCGKEANGERGLAKHIELAHQPAQKATVTCGVCGRGYASPKSLDAHGYEKHKRQGRARKEWMNGAVVKPATPDVPDVPAKADVAADHVINVDEPETIPELREELNAKDAAVSGRKWPPAADRDNAETFAGLPWLTFPTTVEQCDDALNGIAIGIERTQIASPFWLSLRSYITALRKRLAEKVAA
jgi:hypothetical protein